MILEKEIRANHPQPTASVDATCKEAIGMPPLLLSEHRIYPSTLVPNPDEATRAEEKGRGRSDE